MILNLLTGWHLNDQQHENKPEGKHRDSLYMLLTDAQPGQNVIVAICVLHGMAICGYMSDSSYSERAVDADVESLQ